MPKSKLSNSLPAGKSSSKDPIAIIGIGCRYPGGADNPGKLWSLLREGQHVVSEIPSSRIDIEKYYDPQPATPGKMMTRWGGFLENIEQFDAAFFGIAPREAERLDPQQRLLLEVAWEALEDAGQLPSDLVGSRTGVFTGIWLSDFEARLFSDPSAADFYMTTGSGRYSASGRISYILGLQGPSITIDTACSSSLVAVHLACQSLWLDETTLALAGGANVILQPHISIAYSQSKMMAPDGRCKFGDALADGYVRSEGAGLVVLKRLTQALEDGDRIYAVIRGSAVNNDGQSSGFLATPGQEGQEEMLRLAYRDAGVDPRQVQYVEAHGTGTRAGDPIELGALGTVLGRERPSSTPLMVGSVKTNLGHTEGAAGVAGLIKVALAIKNGLIPPSLHVKEFNPNIPWQEWKLTIPTALTPWLDEREKIAGVSAFGIAGTNAHIVLAEAPNVTDHLLKNGSELPCILPLSAQTSEALGDLVKSYLKLLIEDDTPSLNDLCYTASCRRTYHAKRVAVTGKSHQEVAEQLSTYPTEETHKSQHRLAGKPKVAFVFPGQGGQWLGMGRELLRENSAFREAVTQCDQAIKLWADWSLLEQLYLSEDSPAYRLDEINVIQPTLFAIEIALAAVWQSWGVEPAAVIGHSMGEVAAAYVAGALSLEDATRVICMRSQLMQQTSGKGAMAVIGLPYNEVEQLLHAYEGRLSIAVQNSPKSTVVSGDPDALEILMETLRAREIFSRLVNVDVASHSPQMDPIRPVLIESLNDIRPQATNTPFYSTVTQDVREGQTLDAEYWGRNLRQPVRFGQTIERMLEDEHVVFIEMGPHPILLLAIEETHSTVEKPAHGFASLRRNQPELATMLGELGSLFILGFEVDWSKLYANGGKIVSLPSYPWQRERYWFETTGSIKQSRPGAHPLLNQYIRTATGEHIWETTLSMKLFPYLKDHQVRGSIVFPAAAYVEMALAAASEIYSPKQCRIKNVIFKEALFLPFEEDECIIQLVVTSDASEMAGFQIYSRTSQNDSTDAWTLHATGSIEIAHETSEEKLVSVETLNSTIKITAEEFYHAAAERGLEYGANFQAIVQLTREKEEILANLKLSDDIVSEAGKYCLHPILIDACFQSLLAALPFSNQDTYLPISLEAFEFHNTPDLNNEIWCQAIPKEDADGIAGDIFLFNKEMQLVMTVRGIRMQRLAVKQEVQDFLYEIKWQESHLPDHERAESKHWLIFADNDIGKPLAEYLQRDSQTCTLVSRGKAYRSIEADHCELDPSEPAHFKQLLKDVPVPVYGIVHLWSLDQDPTPTIDDSNLLGILYLTQAIAQLDLSNMSYLWLVTRGTQVVLTKPEAVSVSQASVWGMGAVIANEFPKLHCTRIDLSPIPMDGEIQLLAQTLQAQDAEDQVALRNEQRYAARLKRHQVSAENEIKNASQQKVPANQPFQVQISTPGILDGLSIRPALRKSPKAGQVEIAVKATGLNFMNVMGAMGIYPGYPNGVGPLGIECAGIIVNVGKGANDFHPGDEVTGIAFDSLGSHAITDARLIVRKPNFLSFEQAASLPVAYLTAYYALHYLGRMQINERVLIHSATGGVGLAAFQLAKRIGAEIFTTAGSVEKREYLRTLGIQHVMDSRSLTFADEILKNSSGEGVDLVLNSLAGTAIAKGLEVLKPFGRFLEIGKRDIYLNSKMGLLPFQKNLSYFAVDLDKLSRERPEFVGGMLKELFAMIEKGEIGPLPLQTFPVSQTRDAFRMMAQAKHIGKLAIKLNDSDATFEIPAGTISIRPDGAYLITGGLGDLGLIFARWLASRGARYLALLGRSNPSEATQVVLDELRDSGVNVIVTQADVADWDQLSATYAQIVQALPPLKGVIHAAGLLADGTIPQMNPERFIQAFASKALGAWNLHQLTTGQQLDFFILFSSVAGILGTPGQINYAAGNAYMDALARFRHAQNLPALSINWGPWSEIGLASAQENRGERLSQQGLMSVNPSEGLEVMNHLMSLKTSQIAVMSFRPEKWQTSHPGAAQAAFFNDLLHTAAAKTHDLKTPHRIREILLDTEPGKQRKALFETHVLEQVAHVLRMPASRLPTDKPLKTVGLDSLMSLELRNRLEDTLEITIPAASIWNYPTVLDLTAFLATKIDVLLEASSQLNETATTVITQQITLEEPSKDIDHLSKAELDALLQQELSSMEDLLRGRDDEQHS